LKEIKKIDPKIGIIMSTAYSSKDVAVAALKGHADDYVEKPLNVAKIKDSIERLLQVKEGRDDLSACDIASKVDKVRRFTERNCDKKVSLKDAASAVCLSPKYLSRIFKEKMGVSFCHYKSELKIRKARELLAQTGYNISQISDKLGYQNVESFIRTFRKFAHCTPSDYRHKHLSARVEMS
jgi:YesN/AraC family two-component response regulator